MAQRVTVTKTCKLYLGGALARSESGRTVRVTDHQGEFMANAALASRKDGRDAVVAARKGQAAWASATPYNRGQVMYRMAEMMEGRRAELVQALRDLSGLSVARATREVDLAVDSLVHHAGWTDKLATVMGSVNAVSSPFFSYSVPEPTGVVVVTAPAEQGVLGGCGRDDDPGGFGDGVGEERRADRVDAAHDRRELVRPPGMVHERVDREVHLT